MSSAKVVQRGGILYGIQTGGSLKGVDPLAAPSATVRLNPYAGVNWGAVTHYAGVDHVHADPSLNTVMAEVYADGGRVIAFSRYFPEQPVSAADFTSVPADVIILKNSEQHSCTDEPGLHFCPIGSNYSNDGGTHVPWRDAFDAALDALEDPLGGGIVINHPMWSRTVSDADLQAMLDHDPRVLGIEVRNHNVVTNPTPTPPDHKNEPAYPKWDALLATGRRCWGIWAWDHYLPDRAPYLGFNMLLMTEATAQAAGRAYRNGQFYGSLTQQLRITGVAVTGRLVTITTDGADELRMISNIGVETVAASTHTFVVPVGARYARFEGESDADTVYTQPILY